MQLHALIDKNRRDELRKAVARGEPIAFRGKSRTESILPSGLSVFIPYSAGVPMVEAIRKANEAGLVIASNKRIDEALQSDEYKQIEAVFPCRTGTMTGYVDPGKTFREAGEWNDALKSHVIVYVDKETKIRYLFPVPEEHLEKKDSTLVVEHPDFKLEILGIDRIVRAAKTALIETFPADDGWYLAEPRFGIPSGDRIDQTHPDARYLPRYEKMVGLVARGLNWFGSDGRDVLLSTAPSGAFGVAVETRGAA